jgi:hypothetical protein
VASDQRWTGGIANREWQAGRPAEPTVDADYITRQVKLYLADCVKNHLTSTEETCLKVVFHVTGAQKQAVIWAYRRAKSDQYAAAEQRGTETAYQVLDRAAVPGQVSGG